MDCCAPPHPEAKSCPVCGSSGSPVPPATLDALARIAPVPDADVWRFCASLGCDVVWFGQATRETVGRGDVRVRVGAKEAADDRPICYCFDHDARSIVARARTATPVHAVIRDRCRRGEDRCEITNPRGRCCLADVLEVERTAG